jgi:hypothetical protein
MQTCQTCHRPINPRKPFVGIPMRTISGKHKMFFYHTQHYRGNMRRVAHAGRYKRNLTRDLPSEWRQKKTAWGEPIKALSPTKRFSLKVRGQIPWRNPEKIVLPPEWKRMWFFHVTAKKYLPSIQSKGLVGSRIDPVTGGHFSTPEVGERYVERYGDRVLFFAQTPDQAFNYFSGVDTPVMLRFTLPAHLDIRSVREDMTGYFAPIIIRPTFIQFNEGRDFHTKNGWKSICNTTPARKGYFKKNPSVKLTLKRLPATNEWKVCWIENGKLNEAKSYYTDDKADALATMKSMKGQYKINPDKRCPSCGSTNMDKKGKQYQCYSCGAQWHEGKLPTGYTFLKHKMNPRLDSWDKMERVRDHELHRMSTMSKSALYTRIGKVTRPEKLRMFIQIAREHGKIKLAREAQKRLRELGYRSNYKKNPLSKSRCKVCGGKVLPERGHYAPHPRRMICMGCGRLESMCKCAKKNPLVETILASMAAGAASGATFYGISRAMGRPAQHNPRRIRNYATQDGNRFQVAAQGRNREASSWFEHVASGEARRMGSIGSSHSYCGGEVTTFYWYFKTAEEANKFGSMLYSCSPPKSKVYTSSLEKKLDRILRKVQRNPSSGNLKFPFFCGICGTSTPRKGFAGFARTTLQGRKKVVPICVFCARRAGWKGVEHNPTRKFNRFQRMSGIYKCSNCGKMTRDTGEGGAQVELCRKCFIEAERANVEKNPLTGQEYTEITSAADGYIDLASRHKDKSKRQFFAGKATGYDEIAEVYGKSLWAGRMSPMRNPLTKQEISELESLRDTFLEEMDSMDMSTKNELCRHKYLRGQAEAINNIINTYDGRLNTPEEMGEWAKHKINPRRRRRIMTNPRRIRGLPQIRAAELIAGLSPGFLYVVREVIDKNKPGIYDRYQLWPMDMGVEVRDIRSHKIIFIIPYRLAHRVDEIIEDIEERYRYGKPKVVYQKALLHDYKSELEPPIYEYEPIKTKYGMLKKHMPKTVKPEQQVKNIILIRTSTWAAGYSWLPGNFYRGWIGTEKGLKYSIPFRFMEQVYEWLESKGIILPQEITRQRAIIVPAAPVLAKQPPTPQRPPPIPKTSAEESYEYGIEKNPGGMPSQRDVEIAVRKAEEFHDAPPKRMIKIRIPKLNDVLVKIGMWPSVPYFSPKWGKKNQEFAGKKGQLYLHEWEDSEAQRRKRLVVFSPDKKNPSKGWIVAWGRGRLTKHGIEDSIKKS